MNSDLTLTFYYDKSSPSFLRWARNSYSGNGKLQTYVGKEAGSLHQSGHYEVYFNGKLHQVHRIVWVLHYGEIPEGMFIDHIDRDRSNNDIQNLRVVTNAVNCRNQGKRTNNTTGYTGITFSDGGYRAYVLNLDGKRFSKYFSLNKYGTSALPLAIKWREEQITNLNKLGAGYSESHGLS